MIYYQSINAHTHAPHTHIGPRNPPWQDLAMQRLRDQPTLPPSGSIDKVNAAEMWPAVFCAFKDCMWEERLGTDIDLDNHLHEEHSEELRSIADHILRKDAPDAICSVYKQAIAVKCRSQAPVAGTSLDRTALKSFSEASAKDHVQALVCFCCGGIHPYVEEVAEQGEINWYQPVHRRDDDGRLLFLGKEMGMVEKLLGLRPYLQRYNAVGEERTKLTDHETFEDWTLALPNLEDGRLLCCPEAGAVTKKRSPFISFCDACKLLTVEQLRNDITNLINDMPQ